MLLQEIDSRVGNMSLDEIEKYLELLGDKINHNEKKRRRDMAKEEFAELITLLDGQYTLYDKLFIRCRELCKLAGKTEPKYYGKITLSQLEQEFRCEIVIGQDCENNIENAPLKGGKHPCI